METTAARGASASARGSLVRVCVWCWYQAYPHTPFPGQWSSSICQKHRARVRRAYHQRITAEPR
ncbi:MAG: hypothetical protein J2P36_18255 [Ktedonobacteraceae bacterium]|nr:hypothetical protein [Ktedonobacteraceae bacterium]